MDKELVLVLGRILKPATRLNIVGVLVNEKEPISLSEIHRKVCEELNHKFAYNAIYKQIKILEKLNFLKLTTNKKTQGQQVCAIISPDFPKKEVRSFYNYLSKRIDEIAPKSHNQNIK